MNNSGSTNYVSGRVIRGLPFPLSTHDPVAIGSDRGCDVVIEGADSRHAELRWNVDTASWWLHDDPAPGKTFRNGTPVESEELREGDSIDIADVRLRFSGGRLVERDPEDPVGLRVTVDGVSATAGGALRLSNVSFQAIPGSFTAVLGPSGGGKSTLIQRLAGLAPFDGGIRFNGHDLRAESKTLLPLVAYLPQAIESSLHEDMTVRETMEDFSRVHLASGSAPNFGKLLERVGLPQDSFATRRVRLLSGGEKRRLALALALLRDPQLLLLDEPTAGLDPATEEGIMQLLRDIADRGRTVICATHVLGCLDRCDQVLLLAKGGVPVFFGAPDAALAQFGTTEWLAVYRSLQGDHHTRFKSVETPADPSPRALPAAFPPASFGGTFSGTVRRLVRSVAGSWRNLALFFGNPLGIAVVLLLSCRSLIEHYEYGTVYFCMTVAMFWLGVSGEVRSLVAERIPKRCLDRMRGMPLSRYFAAHVAFAALSAVVQALLFISPLFVFTFAHPPFTADAFAPFWFILTFVGFTGGCVGLFVSALSKKELQAVWALPFIAILALFFSKPVLEGPDRKPEGTLRAVEQTMPTLRSQEVLETAMDWARVKAGRLREPQDLVDQNRENWGWFLLLAIGYPIVFLPLAFAIQNWRERQWDGR